MNNTDLILQNQLKILKKDIFSSRNHIEIIKIIDNIYEYINKNWKDIDFFSRFDSLINEILIERVVKDKNYCNSFLIKYLNLYIDIIQLDLYNSWGVIFSKYIGVKLGFRHPKIFADLLMLYPKMFIEEISCNDISFPIYFDDKNVDDSFPLSNTLIKWSSLYEEIINNSSSYAILYNSKIRNKLVFYLYEYYKKYGTLRIWFPFSGTGIEPLLISYIINLIHEQKNKTQIDNKFQFYLSDHSNAILKNALDSNFMDEVFIQIKNDFCTQNKLKPKDISTSKKSARKKIIYQDEDLIYKNNVINKDIDFVIINSHKLSNYKDKSKKDKIDKTLTKLSESFENINIIIELKSDFHIDKTDINFDNFDTIDCISSDFFDKEKDYHLSYFLLKSKQKLNNTINIKENNFDYYYKNRNDIEPSKLKKIILKNEFSTENINPLQFAELLSLCGLYNRAFDIVKKEYKIDYNLSYKILTIIENNCKNIKISNNARTFINENKIKEMGFSAELLEAIIEEIDDYFLENPDSIIKQKMWL